MKPFCFARSVIRFPASYPVWALIGAKLFLRDIERITWKTVLGIFSVVAGTVAIHLGK